jgi:hypothetical protein
LFHVPRREFEQKGQGNFSKNSFGTYIVAGSVGLKGAVINLHIGTTRSGYSSALEVACGPPGIGEKGQGGNEERR